MLQMAHIHKLFFFTFTIIASGAVLSVKAKNFTMVNGCNETIWPGIITHSDGHNGDGFALKPGETTFYSSPTGWSGRIWARTGCNFDKNGNGTCQTGSCGTSLNCTGPSSPPNTIAEFTLGETDFYDVSLVDGFNVPIVVSPGHGKGNCSIAGCDGDLRQSCPPELTVKSDGKVTACRSACDVFNTDEYCCRGTYADPLTCMPSNYSKAFKQVCPAASSYALDDKTSIISCTDQEYIVTFCGTRNQTECSHHNKRLVCNKSTGSRILHQGWWLQMLLALPLLFIVLIKL
ncbi:pathogenesis-related protein 5-like [Tripterygium wilfordii]|uniref:Pathogenesis-related protein 5-like n=1 Tax=Tripterygium wilfordii TaxID=458696 RepID=A0A7J7DCC2_TRIWF|nr:pathogenesis-related thaumatin-like protein 3.5 [Tripterygium wilfordii]KAF5743909.1 pathogenesis-related protein 5-like [Tripterygium wilfordii]